MRGTEEEKDEGVTLSAVIPAYRSAELLARHLPILLGELCRLGETFEVVICDDGSDDDGATREVAEELGAVYVANPRNAGKGAALRRGMGVARGRFRIFTDADIPYEPDVIATMLWYLDFKEFDIVAGDRTLAESSYYHRVPLWRQLGSAVYSAIVGRFVAGGWFDTQCGLKGFRAEVAEDLFGVQRISRFAVDVELFHIALARNYDIKRLPVQLRCQEGSSVRMFRDGLGMVWDLARIRTNQLLGRYRSPRHGARRSGPHGAEAVAPASYGEAELERVAACPVCGATRAAPLYGFDPFGVSRCGGCGSGFLTPRLTAERSAALYRNGYFASGDGESSGYADYAGLEPHLRRTFRRRYRRVATRVRKRAALDVGCAHGYALDVLSREFDGCAGLDLSPAAIEQVRVRGYEGHCGDLLSSPWGPESFDLITCFDTIEHVYQPLPFALKLTELLRPGGIALLATPDLDSWLRRISGRGWVSFKIPEHVTYFTRPSMTRLLERAGLRVQRFSSDVGDYPIELILRRLARAFPSFGRPLLGLARFPGTRRTALPVPNGMFLVVAQKPRPRPGAPLEG
jgi:SAM-dependent methyltransferase